MTPQNLSFQSAKYSSDEVYELTNKCFEEGLLRPGDYFHEFYFPQFVITGVEYLPAKKEFGGVLWYEVASFHPFPNCGHNDEYLHDFSKMSSCSADTLGFFTSPIWLYQVTPQFLRNHISYNSKEIRSFASNLIMNHTSADNLVTVASSKKNRDKWFYEKGLDKAMQALSKTEVPEFNRHLELNLLKREVLELKVAWKREQEESKVVRKRILDLAKQLGEN